MSFLERPDGRIYFEVDGEGPPLALVSGLGGSGSYWNNIVPTLARHFTVVRHDHMGTGKSSMTRGHHSIEALANDVDSLMRHLGHQRYSLVGHSTGAAVGQVLGLERRERLDRVVLFAGWAGPDMHFRQCFSVRKMLLEHIGMKAYNEAAPLFLYPPRWISENSQALATMIKEANATATPVAVAAARIDMIVAFDRRAFLGKMTTPALVLCAKDDFLTPSHLSEELAKLIPGAQLKLLDYGAHACSQTVPQQFLDQIVPFLQG